MTLKKSMLLATTFILLLVAIVTAAGLDRVILAGPSAQSGTSTSTAEIAYEDWRDYTVEYVDSAIDLYEQRGLEAVQEHYNSAESHVGEWYLFAVDENDIYVLHGLFPRLIGTDIKNVTDSTGYELGKDIAKATEEGRWIEYLWPHPVTLTEVPKVAFARRHDGYVFASGYYPVPGDPQTYTQGYVQNAIDLYDSDGLDATVAHYNSPESLDNQWYLTLVSVADETALAHGLNPSLSGTNATDLIDPEGFNTGEALLAAPEDGYWFQTTFFNSVDSSVTRISVWAVRHEGYIFASSYFTGIVASPTPTPVPTPVSTPTPTPTPIPLEAANDADPFKLLIAVLSDAYDNDQLSDILSGLLADLFIDTLITPDTGETRLEAKYRLVIEGPAADRRALAALYNSTDGPNWWKNDNWLSDEPLSEWYGVTTNLSGRVTELELGDNNLNGTLPSELGNLTNLTSLNLRYNSLEGRIPPELGNLTSLRTLLLYGTGLSGEIPRELANLTNLERLLLYSNNLSGEVPVWLEELTNLRRLDLDDNNFTGEIPPELGNLTGLEVLWLSSNQLTGSIPPELGNLEELQRIYLFDNSLSGPIPPELGNLDQLESAYLHENQLSGEIPSELGDLDKLERLYLRGNDLSGEIPVELANLSSLETLHLGDNELTGGIPVELANIATLEWLLLYENGLTGSIPSELSNLDNLEGLFLRNNELSGPIPAELGSLAKLELLSLRDNELSGAIPAELGSLAILEALTVSDNELIGDIPAELGNLTELRTLRISGNDLTGCIPAVLENVRDNDFDELDPPLPFCESEMETTNTDIAIESSFEILIDTPSKTLDTR